MKPAVVRVVVVVIVLALVLAAVGVAITALVSGPGEESGEGPWSPAPTGTAEPGATDAPTPALATYYDQQLDWERCREDFECATLTVPLDYADPGGRTIELALLKDPAAAPDRRLGSLVVNPGGPGAAGTDYAEAASGQFSPAVTEHYDVVGFDPRGTGASAPVDCLTDDELDEYLAADPAPDTDAEVRRTIELASAFGRGCAERSGEVAAHVSTVETVRDLDVLRAALGEAELAYLGASYGTQIGATYAELFPQRVGRLVLDGAVDVSLDARGQALGQARGFETALRSYVRDCVGRGPEGCFLGYTVEEGLATIAGLLDDIDREPLSSSDGRELAVGDAFLGLVTPLYVREYWDLLDRGLEMALDGDGTVLMLMADAYASRGPEGYLNNSSEAIVAINCLDDPGSVPADRIPQEYAAFEKASPTLGRVFAWGLVGCADYPLRASEPAPQVRGAGAAPILVVGTTRDPATPYAWAEALADQLESGVLVTRDGDGHTGYGAGNDCVDAAVDAYLLEGTVPEDGLRC
ncbi:alpha/beta hydrolase [Nocardioides pantholopis]|uniref:alpha/beta hydrolase n=1 Tax=Nocardioides pantholopis TaxID=2483798 RepID=UPI000F085462|nr:alpha/beta hydrolase [Nocardioides pantholopis]